MPFSVRNVRMHRHCQQQLRRRDGPPRKPCWTCKEMHSADECTLQQERKREGACLIWGPWSTGCACSEYESIVKALAPRVPTDHLWCLRRGVSSHATAKCDTNGPTVHFPPEGDSTQRGCLYCGLHGHDMSQCLRRVPVIHEEHQNAGTKHRARISQLSD